MTYPRHSLSFFAALFISVFPYLASVQATDVLKECADANLRKLNEYRHSMGLGSLSMSTEARKRAEDHSMQMASSDRLYHSTSDVYMDYENVAQNWKMGDDDEDMVGSKLFKQWKDSPGHNQNMLASDTNYAGIGCVGMPSGSMEKIYATQIFWRSNYGGKSEDRPTTRPSPISTSTPTAMPTPSAFPTSTATATATLSIMPTMTPTPSMSKAGMLSDESGGRDDYYDYVSPDMDRVPSPSPLATMTPKPSMMKPDDDGEKSSDGDGKGDDHSSYGMDDIYSPSPSPTMSPTKTSSPMMSTKPKPMPPTEYDYNDDMSSDEIDGAFPTTDPDSKRSRRRRRRFPKRTKEADPEQDRGQNHDEAHGKGHEDNSNEKENPFWYHWWPHGRGESGSSDSSDNNDSSSSSDDSGYWIFKWVW